MNCESVGEQLIDLIAGALEPEARVAIERHLQECAGCRRERTELETLWGRLALLDDEHAPAAPSGRLRSRFYRALAEAERQPEGPPAWRRWIDGQRAAWAPTLRPAWSLPALILGVALGASVMWALGAQSEIRRLSAEVDAMSRLVGLSLLEHPSASERLRGVSWSVRAPADDRVVAALLASLREDPNVNVRLAALEALSRRVDSPAVRSGLIEALPRQRSPVLQVALIEVLKQENGAGADRAIEDFLEREDLDDEVKREIEALLRSV